MTADLERGYGDARRDGRGRARGGRGRLQPRGLRRRGRAVAGARSTPRSSPPRAPRATRAGIPLVINARTDVFLTDVVPPEERPSRRSSAAPRTSEAGADCIFVPGVARPGDARARWSREMGGPVSVLAGAAARRSAELARIGVARVSYGPGPLGVAMAALRARGRDAARGRRAARGPRVPPKVQLRGQAPRSGRGAGGDDQRAGRGAAGAAQAVRDRAVEAQRVALAERVDRRRRDRPRARRGRRRSRARRRRRRARRASGGCGADHSRRAEVPPGRRAARGCPCSSRDARRGGRAATASPWRGGAHSWATETSSAAAIRSTEPTLGRARPRSTWLRKGCDSPARRPRPLSVSPRSRRSARTRAPRSVSNPLVEG